MILSLLISSCTDTIPNLENRLIGKWKIVETSGGESGFGYNPNFEILYIDAALRFRLETSSNEIIARGNIQNIDRINDRYSINFLGTEIYIPEPVEIIYGPGFMVEVNEQELHLIAPCCFKMNSFFLRVE